jgi:hypothetical protein
MCTASTMASMGVKMEHLYAKGMTSDIMAAFAFSLSDWMELSFTEQHASNLSNDECLRIFLLEKHELTRLLQTFTPHKSSVFCKSSVID